MVSSRKRKGAEAKVWNQVAETRTRKTKKKGPLQMVRGQAARILKTVLDGAANRRATASIKSLIYRPSIRNKKATMALTCQCLRYLPIIKEVLENSNLLAKIKVQRELLYVMTYELLFGKELIASGGVEDVVLSWKSSLRAALARLLVRKNVQHAQDLLPPERDNGCDGRRYVRVNTLKIEVEEAIRTLRKSLEVEEDDMIPGLLSVPFGTDLHSHPLVSNGELILQGKASCMPALALAPDPGIRCLCCSW